MSIVGAKRLQQGVFEALASSNRAAGSGGGSGFRGLSAVAAAGFTGGITSAGWTTIVSVTMNLTHPADVLVFGNMGWNRTAGTLGDTFWGEIQRDSDADSSTFAIWPDPGTISAGAPNDSLTRTFFLMKVYSAQAIGDHTFNLRATVTGDTFQAEGAITALVFGG